jgi:hypothetical protein
LTEKSGIFSSGRFPQKAYPIIYGMRIGELIDGIIYIFCTDLKLNLWSQTVLLRSLTSVLSLGAWMAYTQLVPKTLSDLGPMLPRVPPSEHPLNVCAKIWIKKIRG